MPSQLDLPKISDHLRVASNALRGQQDELADVRSGSIYNTLEGVTAIGFSREAVRDRDQFRSIYFSLAEDDELTTMVQQRYGIDRILDTYGAGSASFVRPDATGGAGRIYKGTRILVPGPQPLVYQMTADTDANGSQLEVAGVPIEATTYGATQVMENGAGTVMDPLWDSSWTVSNLQCVAGTIFEDAHDFRARVAQTLLDRRKGYATAIEKALSDAGAVEAVLLPYNYDGHIDAGLNVCYVGDASFSGSASLVRKAEIAAENARMLGADIVFLPLASGILAVSMTIALWDDPARFDVVNIRTAAKAAVSQYFDSIANCFAYKVSAIEGNIRRVSNAIQQVTLTSPTVDATLTSRPWPSTLTRWQVIEDAIQVDITGPV